ncbi:hypothetical protein Q8A73_012277 [Channa argus]|nr:hypothetical protein Q8A73_012277 [Channa argus]
MINSNSDYVGIWVGWFIEESGSPWQKPIRVVWLSHHAALLKHLQLSRELAGRLHKVFQSLFGLGRRCKIQFTPRPLGHCTLLTSEDSSELDSSFKMAGGSRGKEAGFFAKGDLSLTSSSINLLSLFDRENELELELCQAVAVVNLSSSKKKEKIYEKSSVMLRM